MRPLSFERFEALIAYTRDPIAIHFVDELRAFSDIDERLLVLICLDTTDNDFTCVLFARDKGRRFRCFSLEHSIPTYKKAIKFCKKLLEEHSEYPDDYFYQGDNQRPFINLFEPLTTIPPEKFSDSFFELCYSFNYTPARNIINEIMPHFVDVDNGQFVRQFQTDGFDQRMWELYLFCYFNEELLKRDTENIVPDFVLKALNGQNLYVEATTIGKPENVEKVPSILHEESQFLDYMRIKWLRALRKKRNHKHNGVFYWEREQQKKSPFLIAIADFHTNTRRTSTQEIELASLYKSHIALWQCLYGVTEELTYDNRGNVKPNIVEITNPESNSQGRKYGFFYEQNSEYVSAVISTNVGTIAKFQRMGQKAGFGSSRLEMIMLTEIYDRDPKASKPLLVRWDVNSSNFQESWSTGVSIYHNPHAKYPLNPENFPNATHYFFDGSQIHAQFNDDWFPYSILNFSMPLDDRIPMNNSISL